MLGGSKPSSTLAPVNKLRLRTEWMSREDARLKGEVRNIKILGIISGRLVVAYQGGGSVRVFNANESSLELEEVGDGQWHSRYQQFIQGRDHRFVEFRAPPLPTSILAVGCTEAEDDVSEAPCRRPAHEARSTARLSVCGQVTSSQVFQSMAGVPRRSTSRCSTGSELRASLAIHVRNELSASQKVYM